MHSDLPPLFLLKFEVAIILRDCASEFNMGLDGSGSTMKRSNGGHSPAAYLKIASARRRWLESTRQTGRAE